MAAEIDTSWVIPGASIVVYRQDREWATRPVVRLTTVAKIATKSFLVDGIDERIRLDTLRSKDFGGTWHSWQWVAVHPESEVAKRLLALARLNRFANQAHYAVVEWNTGETRADVAKIDAVIAAFQRYRAALGVREGDGDVS